MKSGKRLMPLFFLLVMTLFACSRKEYYKYTITLSDSFNTTNNVILFTYGAVDANRRVEAYENMDDILINLDHKFNVQPRNDGIITDLMRINANAGVNPVKVDAEVIEVLTITLEISERSVVDGIALFDPTILPVANLWDITHRQYNFFDDNKINDEDLPSANDIDAALDLVNFRDVVINREENTVFLKRAGMMIDLGAVVKGYAADKIKQYLMANGYNKAIIDIGRNILTVGSFVNADLEDVPYVIGIQRPYANGIIGTVLIDNETIVTSGIYEKYILTNSGKSYHHIFNPQTGYPMNNNVVGISVICEESVLGDALSTTLFLLGPDRAMALVDELDFRVETIWILESAEHEGYYEVYISYGLEEKFTFNTDLENNKYIYKGVYNADAFN